MPLSAVRRARAAVVLLAIYFAASSLVLPGRAAVGAPLQQTAGATASVTVSAPSSVSAVPPLTDPYSAQANCVSASNEYDTCVMSEGTPDLVAFAYGSGATCLSGTCDPEASISNGQVQVWVYVSVRDYSYSDERVGPADFRLSGPGLGAPAGGNGGQPPSNSLGAPFPSTTLQPGQQIAGWVTWSLPETSSTYELQWNLGSGGAHWADLALLTVTVTQPPPPSQLCNPSDTSIRHSHAASADPTTVLAGGETTDLTATGLPPNASLLLLFSGSRALVQGEVNRPVPYSESLGVFSTDGQGSLKATVRIPRDAAQGSATVNAFRTDGLRRPPVKTWTLSVTPHAPVITLKGKPGDTFRIHPVAAPKGHKYRAQSDTVRATDDSSSACSATLGSSGQDSYTVPAGWNEVDGPDGGAVDGYTPPGSDTTYSASQIAQTVYKDIDFLSITDSASGESNSQGGVGPLGYFLSHVNITDNVTILAATTDGQPLPGNPSLTATFIAPNGSTLAQDININVTGQTSSYTEFDFQLNPGLLPPGETMMNLTLSSDQATGSKGRQIPIDVIDPHWNNTDFLQWSSITFDGQSYHADGTIPPNAPNFDMSVDPGWDSYNLWGPVTLPGKRYHIENDGIAGIFIHEDFSTVGHWSTNTSGDLGLTLLNQTLIPRQHVPFDSDNQDPQRPGYGFPRQQLLDWSYGPDTIFSFVLAGFKIPYINVGLDLEARIELALAAQAYYSATINPDLTPNQMYLELDPSGSLSATLAAEAGGYGGIDGDLTFDLQGRAKILIDDQFHLVPQYCLVGTLSADVSWWYSEWDIFGTHEGNGYFLEPTTLGQFSFPDGCTIPPAGIRSHAALKDQRPAASGSSPPVRRNPASPNVSVDSKGNGMAVWVQSNAVTHKDTLMAAAGSGSGWGSPQSIAEGGAILSPHVAELGGGKAVATWVQNTISQADVPALEKLADKNDPTKQIEAMIAYQELFTSTYSGGHWSIPHALTRDKIVDNDPAIAADEKHHRALIVWSHGNGASGTELLASKFNGKTWSKPVIVPGTKGSMPRKASLVSGSAGKYTLAWIDGPLWAGQAHLSTFTGKKWKKGGNLGLPPGVQDVVLAHRGKGLAVAASVLAGAPNTLPSGEPAIYAGTSKGSSWTVAKVADQGDSPQLSGDARGNVVLIFHEPPVGASSASQLAYSIGTASGPFTAPALLTGENMASTSPGMALDPAKSTVRLVYERHGVTDMFDDPAWEWAVKPGTTSLDDITGLVGAVVPIAGKAVADLANASLGPAHANPGSTSTVSVPIHDVGIGAITLSGAQVAAQSAGQTIGSAGLNGAVLPGTPINTTFTITVPTTPVTLSASGIQTTASPADLNVPLAPTQLAAQKGKASVELHWVPAPDHDIVQFRVYRSDGGAFALIGLSTNPSYVDSTAGAVSARYAVTAVDKDGRESMLSPTATTTTPGIHPLIR